MTLLTLQEASTWAAKLLKEDISPSNISYLVQYGKVRKYGAKGATRIALEDLRTYFKNYREKREVNWRKICGSDLQWALSFEHLREKETTKHVHRLHPYKGKFIPQLAEYFLDTHTDDCKKTVYFRKNDTVLDPFLGSGTTVVQANELGLHSIGIDISHFNCVITESKVQQYDMKKVEDTLCRMKDVIQRMERDLRIHEFDADLQQSLSVFNAKYFPSPQFKYDVHRDNIDEDSYASEKSQEFLAIERALRRKYSIPLPRKTEGSFLDRWYVESVRREIDCLVKYVNGQNEGHIRKLLAVVVSRTARSCRATTHSDLATLKEPQFTTYYCYKHKKICKPLFSLRTMLNRYADDTLTRLKDFSALKTAARFTVIPGDSRTVSIAKEVESRHPEFAALLRTKKIRGIFSSPPYVGQIDYHEQHAYAYDLFGFARQDDAEIGPLYKGQGRAARDSYVDGIVSVLTNCKPHLSKDYDIFLVANDKWDLYPTIAEKAGMRIVQRFKRPVLNRTERDRNPYSETIFHLKEKH